MFGDPQADSSFSASAKVTQGVDGAGLGSPSCAEDSCDCCGSMMNVSRRDAGVLNVRNSIVGETVGFTGVALLTGTRLPFRLARARGSIDLRRRLPPRGTKDVSMA